MEPIDSESQEPVDIFQIRFPRMTQAQAVKTLMGLTGGEKAQGVAFPDMSTLNQAHSDPEFKQLLQSRLKVMNDGAGLAWIARRLGRPFPENLNGTNLCPALMDLAPENTKIYILGTKPGSIEITHAAMAKRFPHIQFVGSRNGYFSRAEEPGIVAEIQKTKPDIVLVGMGNPRQVQFIARHLDDPKFGGTLFLAIGGFLDYWAGNIVRAPKWMRRLSLEWFFLMIIQPHKIKRYMVGIPLFMLRCLWADFRNQHACPEQEISP